MTVIPVVAIEAAAKALYENQTGMEWESRSDALKALMYADARAALEAAAALSEEWKPVRTYYRSITPDHKMWCESRDPKEVIRMSEGQECTFEMMRFYEITEGWEEWVGGVDE